MGVVPGVEGAEASLREMLTAALEANREMARLVAQLREENAGLVALNAQQAAELQSLRADLAVLQRMVFGRSSERSGPQPGPGAGGVGRGGQQRDGGGKRGPGARAGRRDYSHLPRVEVIWDFDAGGYCCPQCGQAFTLLGDHVSGEQVAGRWSCGWWRIAGAATSGRARVGCRSR